MLVFVVFLLLLEFAVAEDQAERRERERSEPLLNKRLSRSSGVPIQYEV